MKNLLIERLLMVCIIYIHISKFLKECLKFLGRIFSFEFFGILVSYDLNDTGN